MPAYLNGQKLDVPYIHGKKCNAYIGGKKIWKTSLPNNIKFLAATLVSGNYDYGVFSSNKDNWHKLKLPINNPKDIIFVNNKFILINYEKLSYSSDLINWTTITLPDTANGGGRGSYPFNNISYHNGIYVASLPYGIIESDTGNINRWKCFTYSYDLINWFFTRTYPTENASSVRESTHIIKCCNDRFVALTSGGNPIYVLNNQAMYSLDGIDWYNFKLPSIEYFYGSNNSRELLQYKDIIFAKNKYVALTERKFIAYSSDFINWNHVELPETNAIYSRFLCYYNNNFYAFFDNAIFQSSNGISWTIYKTWTSYDNYSYYDGVFFRTIYNARIGSYSTDLTNWTDFLLPLVDNKIAGFNLVRNL
jgi:hypothetical protein